MVNFIPPYTLTGNGVTSDTGAVESIGASGIQNIAEIHRLYRIVTGTRRLDEIAWIPRIAVEIGIRNIRSPRTERAVRIDRTAGNGESVRGIDIPGQTDVGNAGDHFSNRTS
jgi:hypothetical protein